VGGVLIVSNFVSVTHEQFFAVMNPRNVTPYPRGNYPYVSEWTLSNGRVIGRSRDESYELAADLDIAKGDRL